MRLLLITALILCHSLFGSETTIVVDTLFASHDIYKNGVTHNIAQFHYASDTSTENPILSPPDDTVRIGIFSPTQNTWVDTIWEYQPQRSDFQSNIIQSITIQDLNYDQQDDLIIYYYDAESDYPDQVTSTFLMNNDGQFQEVNETFVQNRFELLPNGQIKYERPLSLFGRPYVDEEPSTDAKYWTDYYEFQGLKLVNINQKYRSFYEALKITATRELDDTLTRIKTYNMSDESTMNQLQLEEFYNHVTELKTMLFRINQVLY